MGMFGTNFTALQTNSAVDHRNYVFPSGITVSGGNQTMSVNYAIDNIDVFVRGIKMAQSDYTAVNGTTISIAVATLTLLTGDEVTCIGRKFPTSEIMSSSSVNITGGVISGGTRIILDRQVVSNPQRGEFLFDSDTGHYKGYDGTQYIDMQKIASGGEIAEYIDGGVRYRSHTFRGSGRFYAEQNITNCDILVIAGGGAGGNNQTVSSNGGGGGGGVVTQTQALIPQGYSICQIGSGAPGRLWWNANPAPGNRGADSKFTYASTILHSIGGGGGAGYGEAYMSGADLSLDAPFSTDIGTTHDGGSGGGVSEQNGTVGNSIQHTAGTSTDSLQNIIAYGSAGSPAGTTSNNTGGGGGGAGGAGFQGSAQWGDNWPTGNGGIGIVNNWRTGEDEYLAGGGGGGGDSSERAGNGMFGGGRGASSSDYGYPAKDTWAAANPTNVNKNFPQLDALWPNGNTVWKCVDDYKIGAFMGQTAEQFGTEGVMDPYTKGSRMLDGLRSTGGGGGAGTYYHPEVPRGSGSGGSGVIIIRYRI
jgi:hypothetical protein